MNLYFRIAGLAFLIPAGLHICAGLIADESSAKALVCLAVGAVVRWVGTDLEGKP